MCAVFLLYKCKVFGSIHKILLPVTLRSQSPASLSFSVRPRQTEAITFHSGICWDLRKQPRVPGTKTLPQWLWSSSIGLWDGDYLLLKDKWERELWSALCPWLCWWVEESKWILACGTLDSVSSLSLLSFLSMQWIMLREGNIDRGVPHQAEMCSPILIPLQTSWLPIFPLLASSCQFLMCWGEQERISF